MKNIIVLLILLSMTVFAQQKSSFTDSRDGKVYKTVKIGTQIWLVENLNYDTNGSKCYEDNSDNCTKYGRLYDWNTALEVCPSGWYLPSESEWWDLMNAVGGAGGAGTKLKSKNGWDEEDEGKPNNGTDEFGFSALPGGNGDSDGSFSNVGAAGFFWTATAFPSTDDIAYSWCMYYGMALWGTSNKSLLYSIRCLQENH